MKKYISMLAFVALFILGMTSCDPETNEEPGGTAIEKMCGEWSVYMWGLDPNTGEVLYEDPYGMGVFSIMTYNTSANSTDEMWIDDLGQFWAFQFKVPIDYSARTFSCSSTPYDADETGNAIITNGKILEGAGHNIHGMPVDSITFDIQFDDDNNGLLYHFEGTRYQGFTE